MSHVTMRLHAFLFATALVAASAMPSRLEAQGGAPAEAVGGLPAGGVVGMGPNGATLRCRDGFFPAPGAADSACQDRGGVAMRFPVKRTPSRAANNARTAALRDAAASPRTAAVAQPDTSRPAGFEPFAVRRQRADSANRAVGTKPEGATLLCNDGQWVLRDTSSARCASRGGVRISFPLRP